MVCLELQAGLFSIPEIKGSPDSSWVFFKRGREERRLGKRQEEQGKALRNMQRDE